MVLDTTRYDKNQCVHKPEEDLGHYEHLANRGVRVTHVWKEALKIGTF